MGNKIIIGRNEADKKEFGEAGTVYLGKLFVNMGQTTALSNEIYLDVVRTHVMLISGKRGGGKSYSASVIAEEMSRLPDDIKKNITVLFFDTMGVFWTMKYPNTRQEDLLIQWGLTAEGINIILYTPKGYFQQQKEKGIPVDFSFALKTSELNAGDWCNVFDIKLTDPLGILIERTLDIAQKQKKEYDIQDIINVISNDTKSKKEDRNGAEIRFLAANKWGLFARDGTTIEQLLQPGSVNVIDISVYTNTAGNWGIKNLVIGLVSRKIFEERMKARKIEEIVDIQKHKSYFSEDEAQGTPMVWIMIDEAHEALPRVGKTPATDALVQLLREGRQPGISLCLVTQQPGEIHHDVMTQADIVLSHRLTAKRDIEALNSMMQSYLVTDLQEYLNTLPRDKGAAILLDDNSERIYPMRVHPKRSWHGGDAPAAIKTKKKILEF